MAQMPRLIAEFLRGKRVAVAGLSRGAGSAATNGAETRRREFFRTRCDPESRSPAAGFSPLAAVLRQKSHLSNSRRR